jgi:hypothetical protein
MLIRYLTINNLPKEQLKEAWEVLKDIKGKLEIDAPSTNIYLQRYPEYNNKTRLLRQFEQIDKILKIEESKSTPDYWLVTVEMDKFGAFCNQVEERKRILFPGEAVGELPSTRVEITKVPEISIKGFEEKVILQKPKNKRILLKQFPVDTKWEDIIIQFLNGQEVIIKVKDLTSQTTYEELGFQDEKRKLPNKQWEFLKNLSETGGEISWKSSKATAKGKKQKQLLAETLKTYFQIDDDPFYVYRQEKSYKIRINLIPEGGSGPNTKEQKVIEDKEDKLGIEEYRKEQSPERYDK